MRKSILWAGFRLAVVGIPGTTGRSPPEGGAHAHLWDIARLSAPANACLTTVFTGLLVSSAKQASAKGQVGARKSEGNRKDPPLLLQESHLLVPLIEVEFQATSG